MSIYNIIAVFFRFQQKIIVIEIIRNLKKNWPNFL